MLLNKIIIGINLYVNVILESSSQFLLYFFPHVAFDADSRYLSSEDQNRELTRSIRREVAKLTEQWNHLINRSDNWKHRLDEYMTVSNFFLSFFFVKNLLIFISFFSSSIWG